jgi:hypothetical protein
MGYNLAVMRDIIDEKTTASQAVDRSRIAAEHMYSNYRFKSVRLTVARRITVGISIDAVDHPHRFWYQRYLYGHGDCNVHGGACTGRVSVCRDVPY